MSSHGLTYLITGANRGIGQGLVSHLLKQPSTTVIAAVRDTTKASSQALQDLPKGHDSRLILIKIDSADDSDPSSAVETLTKQHGIESLDVVIANAGICHSGTTVLETSHSALVEHVAINVAAPITLLQATAPLLKASKSGRPTFVATTSFIGTIGGMEQLSRLPAAFSPYGGSKAALNWFVRRLHFEESWLISFVIHPGLVLTEMADESFAAAGVDPRDIGAIEVDESVTGIASRIAAATRDISGTFQSYDGKILPW